MDKDENPALVALARVLADASQRSSTPAADILVQLLELRSRTGDPTPLPPGFFIRLGNGLEYFADTQGNISPMRERRVDDELRIRFIQQGGLGGWISTFEADETTLPAGDVTEVRQLLGEADFFNLPDEVRNGDPIPDLYSYTLWVAVGRNNKTVTTYDGTGPHENPALETLIGWLKERSQQPLP